MELGACIIHIDFFYEENEKIIVENDDIPFVEALNKEFLLQHFENNSFGNIKVLIIGAQNGF